MYFVFEITGPAIAVSYLALTRVDAAPSLFGFPFCDWGSITCAFWALVGVHHGPFLISRSPNAEKEK